MANLKEISARQLLMSHCCHYANSKLRMNGIEAKSEDQLDALLLLNKTFIPKHVKPFMLLKKKKELPDDIKDELKERMKSAIRTLYVFLGTYVC